MAITRSHTLTDDDGTGTTGSILNAADRSGLYDDIDGRWSRVTISLTGSNNNVSVSEADVVYLSNASLLTITGIVAPASPAKPGKPLWLVAAGAGQVDFVNASGSSTAANRLLNFATSGNTSLAPGSASVQGGAACYVYDDVNSRWRLVFHEQGALITPTFAAGTYTGNGAMTWTLTAGDVTSQKYRLSGRTVTASWSLATTTVGGTPNTSLQIGNAAWGGFTGSALEMANAMGFVSDNGTPTTGYAQINAGGTFIRCIRSNQANWAAATDTTALVGQISFEVT